MNVTEFAEQVVFGTTLEDKLLVPGKLTLDLRPTGPNVDSLAAPGRPQGLQMKTSPGGSAQPPGDDSLENEQARGQLLHFLANHELLATELMALVLLKFPNAPHAFRQGVLVTLQEEQEHTRMYIRRMKECGVEFGSYPLSGQFWRMIEPMQSPMDFVSRLSLTFEQANLDYSLHFASVFRKLGDLQTASVLQKIYEDEIGHVQHGLHWFRQWKDPEQSDWEAYQESLDFPMSPQRALGPRGAFNRDGRVQAGLTTDFIDAIEVFRQSRGRAPTVRWFDPAVESELAGELSPRELPLMEQLGKDLELAMVPIAKQDDVVLVRRMPSREFRKQLIDAGFNLPEFVPFEQRSSLVVRKLNDFAPWAWTPKNHDVAGPLLGSGRHAPNSWQPKSCELFRKSWGARKLKEWLGGNGQGDTPPIWFTSVKCVAIPVHTVADVPAALEELADRGYSTALFKQDLAASGRGQRSLSCCEELSPEDNTWLQAMFSGAKNNSRESSSERRSYPVGVIEPKLDRVIDLSFLWHIPHDSQALRYCGWTRPLITRGRRYSGTRLGNALAGCDERIRRFLLANRGARLQSAVDWLEPRVAQELRSRNFTGHFGVDALVCQNQNGGLEVKPLVELNPRMTMGHVALNLDKRLAPGATAEFRVFTKGDWDEIHQELSRIPFVKTADGRWKSGVVKLGEVDTQTKLIPVVLVGETALKLADDSPAKK